MNNGEKDQVRLKAIKKFVNAVILHPKLVHISFDSKIFIDYF